MILKVYHGYGRVDPTDPRALAVCDRCGQWDNLNRLSWQFEWSGTQLRNTRFLVCKRCLDIPNIQNKTIILPPDPKPLLNSRPEPFTQDENTFITTQESDEIITQDDDNIITE